MTEQTTPTQFWDFTTEEGIRAYLVAKSKVPLARAGSEAAKRGSPDDIRKLCQDRGVSAAGWA